MATHDENRKERLDVSYILFGIGADVCQMARAYLRGESKGVRKNVSQIITKLETVRKRI